MQPKKNYHYSLYNALYGLIIAAIAGVIYLIFNWKEATQQIVEYFKSVNL